MAFDSKASYYDAGGIETIKILVAKLTPVLFAGWLMGNVLKYACRCLHKGQLLRDVEKIHKYSGQLLEHLNKHPKLIKEISQ